MTPKIRLYACGGAGLNIASKLNQDLADICYIDTSEANLNGQFDPDKVYRFEGLSGSGGFRAQNYKVIAPLINQILDLFVPGDFNIVLFSADGGSGSITGPLILRALLEEKATAVSVVVGSDHSKVAVTNTINTFKTLENHALQTQVPVVMSYHENRTGVPMSVVDGDVLFVLESLCLLANQNHHGLDLMDVTNWTQFNKVTPVKPQLAGLTVTDDRKYATSVQEPITILSLYSEPDRVSAFSTPFHAKAGFPRNEVLTGDEQIHYIVNLPLIEEINKNLAERETELNRAHGSYRQRKALTDSYDDVTPDGTVL